MEITFQLVHTTAHDLSVVPPCGTSSLIHETQGNTACLYRSVDDDGTSPEREEWQARMCISSMGAPAVLNLQNLVPAKIN